MVGRLERWYFDEYWYHIFGKVCSTGLSPILEIKSEHDMYNIIKLFLIPIVAISLVACKAEKLTIELNDKHIESAISGTEELAEFEVLFEFKGELDNKKKAKLDAIEKIVRASMDIDEFTITGDGKNTQVEILGYIPISTKENLNTAWYMHISQFVGKTHTVRFTSGGQYEDLKKRISRIGSRFVPNEYHPTTIKFKAKNTKITVPAGYIDGKPKVMWSNNIDGRVVMRFSDGIFDDVGGAFLYDQK